MRLIAVAAVAENGVIGRNGDVPWSLPADRRQYRDRVANSPVILGRPTFETMRGDLPGATQLVLTTKDRQYPEPTVTVVHSVEDTLDTLSARDIECAYVLGGATVYELFLPHLTDMYLSRVPATPEGTASFPAFDREAWTLVEETPADGFTLEHWHRRDR
ncbi:MAG: dihydrofolate reductase [Halobacteriaceae archaeon]